MLSDTIVIYKNVFWYLNIFLHFNSGDYCYPSTITVNEGTPVNFTSPLYPEPFPEDVDCEYTINVEDGYKVVVEFLDFEVQDDFDFLYLDGKSFTDSSMIPDKFLSNSSRLTIRFMSDFINFGARGYLLRLTAVPESGKHVIKLNLNRPRRFLAN